MHRKNLTRSSKSSELSSYLLRYLCKDSFEIQTVLGWWPPSVPDIYQFETLYFSVISSVYIVTIGDFNFELYILNSVWLVASFCFSEKLSGKGRRWETSEVKHCSQFENSWFRNISWRGVMTSLAGGLFFLELFSPLFHSTNKIESFLSVYGLSVIVVYPQRINRTQRSRLQTSQSFLALSVDVSLSAIAYTFLDYDSNWLLQYFLLAEIWTYEPLISLNLSRCWRK